MIHTLVVTLGRLGEALIESADHIIGSSRRVSFLCLDWGDDLESWQQSLSARIDRLKEHGGILLLTDMYGGSSTNIALDYLVEGEVEIVTGVNLPMLIKAMTLPDGIRLADAADQLRSQGRKSIYIASEML